MRRRQIYAMRAAEAVFETKTGPVAVEQEEWKPAKGQCPKCRKMVGRGLHFHVKSCE